MFDLFFKFAYKVFIFGAFISLSLSGGLEVIYPELDLDKCIIIPKDQKLREKVSTVWTAPEIYFPGAQKVKYINIWICVCVCAKCFGCIRVKWWENKKEIRSKTADSCQF